MSDIAIRVENLSKQYSIGETLKRHDTLRDAVVAALRSPFRRRSANVQNAAEDAENVIWALKDVSFEVKRGEVVGLIGRNGAGKSTLLKILSRITEPTAGQAKIKGRVRSLLEVGTGFHPELTGRENIHLSGAILGMSRIDIERKFDEIVDFSGVEKFIDTPVKRYSSGMKVRLGFAVAAHLEPEVLLIDEVLAVGDVGFQKKCLGKMENVASSGRTVLFVSHSMAAIEKLCSRGILLDNGKIVSNTSASEAVSHYLSLFDTKLSYRDFTMRIEGRIGTSQAKFQRAEILSLSGEKTSSIQMGHGICVHLEILANSPVSGIVFGIGLYGKQGLRLCGFNSHDLSEMTVDLYAGQKIIVKCTIPKMNFAPGHYRLNLLMKDQSQQIVDLVEQAISFEIVEADVFGTGRIPKGNNIVFLNADWFCQNVKAVN